MKKPNWLEQNPCDWYNNNKFEDALSLILRKDKVLRYEDGNLFLVRDKDVIIVASKECNDLRIESENSFGFVIGMTYSPFQILTKVRYNSNFKLLLSKNIDL